MTNGLWQNGFVYLKEDIMTEQEELVDVKETFEEGVVISQNSLRDLSWYAGEQIDYCVNFMINYDNSDKKKAQMHFWMKVLKFKSKCLSKEFTGNDFRTKTLGVIKYKGRYLTYWDDGKCRLSNISEIGIYFALKVKEKQLDVEEAIDAFNSLLKPCPAFL